MKLGNATLGSALALVLSIASVPAHATDLTDADRDVIRTACADLVEEIMEARFSRAEVVSMSEVSTRDATMPEHLREVRPEVRRADEETRQRVAAAAGSRDRRINMFEVHQDEGNPIQRHAIEITLTEGYVSAFTRTNTVTCAVYAPSGLSLASYPPRNPRINEATLFDHLTLQLAL